MSVTLAVATIPVMYLTASRLFSRRVSAVACALLAIQPFFVRYAQEALVAIRPRRLAIVAVAMLLTLAGHGLHWGVLRTGGRCSGPA